MTTDFRDSMDGIESAVTSAEARSLLRIWREASPDRGLPCLDDVSVERLGPIASFCLYARRLPNGDYVYDYYGQAVAAMTKCDRAGFRVSELPRDFALRFKRGYDDCLAAGEPVYTVQRATYAPEVMTWERLTLPLVTRDGVSAVLVFKRALEMQHTFLQNVLKATSDGVIALCSLGGESRSLEDMAVVVANPAAIDTLGVPLEQVLDRPFQQLIDACELAPVFARCAEAFSADGTISYDVEHGGLWRRVSAAYSEDGLAITIADITPYKEQEQALRRALRRLADAVDELGQKNRDLNDLTETLQAAVLEKEEAARVLADEIRSRKLMQRRLEFDANADPLTGLHNYRQFQVLATQELRRAARSRSATSLVLLRAQDLDAIGAAHGEAVQDAVLRSLAGRVAESLRESDIFGRVGEDSFAALLPDTALAGAQEVADRMRRLGADTSVDSGDACISPPLDVAAVTAAPGDRRFEALLASALATMEKSEAAGRHVA